MNLGWIVCSWACANQYVSSGSSNNIGSIGGKGGDKGRIIRGESYDAEQSLVVGTFSPCIIIVTSSLLVLFLNHLVYNNTNNIQNQKNTHTDH